MCLQDLWISQYLEGTMYEVVITGAGTGVLLAANPKRWAVSINTTSTTPAFAFGFTPSAASTGFTGSGKNNQSIYTRAMLGNLVAKPVQYFATGGVTVSVTEVTMTLPLEEILARYNQEFRKANGIETWVPNLPLPPTITPNSSQPSKRY